MCSNWSVIFFCCDISNFHAGGQPTRNKKKCARSPDHFAAFPNKKTKHNHLFRAKRAAFPDSSTFKNTSELVKEQRRCLVTHQKIALYHLLSCEARSMLSNKARPRTEMLILRQLDNVKKVPSRRTIASCSRVT